MPRSTTAPALVERAYDLWLWLEPHLAQAPATARASLGRHVTDAAVTLLDLLLQATYEPRGSADTPVLLRRAAQRVALLRYLLRAMRDLRLLSLDQHAHAAARIDELGRMIHGWRRALPR